MNWGNGARAAGSGKEAVAESGGKKVALGSYRELLVWQDAMALAEATYRLTSALPKEEVYGLSSQMRRSAVSIPSNIAEGYARESPASYLQFLRIARGSLRELETQLMLATRVGLLSGEKVDEALGICDAVGRKLHGLIRSIKAE